MRSDLRFTLQATPPEATAAAIASHALGGESDTDGAGPAVDTAAVASGGANHGDDGIYYHRELAVRSLDGACGFRLLLFFGGERAVRFSAVGLQRHANCVELGACTADSSASASPGLRCDVITISGYNGISDKEEPRFSGLFPEAETPRAKQFPRKKVQPLRSRFGGHFQAPFSSMPPRTRPHDRRCLVHMPVGI